MDTQILWQLGLQLFLIISNALFACAEIAVISMNEHKLAKLAHNGDKRAKQLVKLTEQPAKFLATIQVAITFSGFLASAFAADNFSDAFVNLFIKMGFEADVRVLDAISVVLITFLLSYVTLVFGELVPKRIAMKKAQTLALALASLISIVAKTTSPLVWLLTKSTNAVLRMIGINPHSDDSNVSEEEIIMMIDAGSQLGIIDDDEKNIIHNIFDFDDIDISKVTTHRTKLDVLWLADTPEDWENTICETKHARYLLCDEVIDNVVGVIKTRDYFCAKEKSKEKILNTIVRPPFYVLESIHADIVFKQMKLKREQLAVVVDEYGGTLGIVTINDLLEELVGNIDDDLADTNLDEIKCIGDSWKIKGSTQLDTIEDKFEIILPKHEYHTFAGYVFGLYGSIPDDGTSIEVDTDDLHIKVEEIKDRMLISAIVRVKKTQEPCKTENINEIQLKNENQNEIKNDENTTL